MNSIKKYFEKIILGRVFYCTESGSYQYDHEAQSFKELPFKESDVPYLSVLILAPELYNEAVEFYPIRNEGELNKALKIKHSKKTFFFEKKSHESNGFNVCSWEITDCNVKSVLKIPVSKLLASYLSLGEVLQLQGFTGEVDFVSNQRGFPVSSRKTQVLSCPEFFSQSIGEFYKSSKVIKVSSQLSEMVKFDMQTFSLMKRCIVKPQFDNTSLFSKKNIIALVLGGGLYLSLSSGYLLWQQSKYTSKVNVMADGVNSSLSSLNVYEKNVSLISGYTKGWSSHKVTSPSWLVVEKLSKNFGSNLILNTFRYDNSNYFTLIGEVDKATDVLIFLKQLDEVEEARFDNATRKTGSKESFHVVFKLSGA